MRKLFEKGNKIATGRPKGVANKMTTELKDMIKQALDESGGVDYLKNCALENPTAFLSLLGKIIPKDLNVSGTDGEPLIITIRGYEPNK